MLDLPLRPSAGAKHWKLTGRAVAGVSTARARARAGARAPLLTLGDSHARVFTARPFRTSARTAGWEAATVSVSGATASGLRNPNSVTQAMPIFDAALRAAGPEATVALMLGEVDAGFLIWARGRDGVEERYAASLASYTAFLDRLQAERRRVLVYAVPPPVVESYAAWRGLGQARRDVDATLAERWQLTARYNADLADWCARHQASFVDYWPLVTTEDRVRAAYAPKHDDDHHLDQLPFAGALSTLLPAARR